jgi:hypothetical protein
MMSLSAKALATAVCSHLIVSTYESHGDEIELLTMARNAGVPRRFRKSISTATSIASSLAVDWSRTQGAAEPMS